MTNLDRSEINRALAKAIAYKACGKDRVAETWATEVIKLLGCAGILTADAMTKAALRADLEG